MNTKFKLTKKFKVWFGIKLWRIKALKDFSNVSKGELGGFVEKEENLSEENDAWVSGDAWVYGYAQVYGDAQVYGYAQVFGDAWVYGELKLELGYFFGMSWDKEEIKFVDIPGTNDRLVCKGDIKVSTTEKDKTVELTLDEIAKKFNVDVRNLKVNL